ncbi:MAG: hypothetical protein KY464_16465, partial [Gemmatimonadetes bacterium]|nr:hypothetical protein [Gemmatimonadota bacterium]
GAVSRGAALVLDLGTVSEDALALSEEGTDAGVDDRGQPWGRGILDQEWDPAREAWIPGVHDQAGLWAARCGGSPGETYALGDARSNCTRGNGLPDTEDLNGNGALDTEERVLRYVVDLADPASEYLARGQEQTGTTYRLYRIPLRSGASVGASAGALEHVQHVRILLAGDGDLTSAVTRMRFVGSRWRKRSASGIVRGLVGGDTLASGPGDLQVGPVSRVTLGPAYVSPPGIRDERQNPADDFGAFGGAEYNEKSLALRYRDVAPGDRAEAVLPFESRPRNLLGYRALRFWAAAAEGGGAGEELVLRLGSDARNSYLYRQPLKRTGRPRTPAEWGAEAVVEFARWTELRALAEAALHERPAGDREPVVMWSADSTYGIVITDRGRAPNLAAVAQVSLGIWNGSPGAISGELWIDDIRLADAVREPGTAGHLSVGVRRAGVFQVDLTYSSRSGHFREFRQAAQYEGRSALTLTSTWDAGRLLPAQWRIEAPVTVQHQAAGTDPILLAQSDLPVSHLAGVRVPRTGSTRLGFRLGRRAARGSPSSPLLDGLSAQLAYESGGATALYSTNRGAQVQASLRYRLEPVARSLALLPDSTGEERRGFRGWLGRSAVARAVAPRRLRWTPTALTLTTEYSNSSDERARFTMVLPGAGEVSNEQAFRRRLIQNLSVGFRPFSSLGADLSFRTSRDLLPNGLQNSAAALAIARERTRVGPVDVGREFERSVHTSLTWSPRLASWLSGQAVVDTRYSMDANPSYTRSGRVAGDTIPELLRALNGQRDLRARLTLVPAALATALGLSDSRRVGEAGSRLARVVGPVEMNWSRGLHALYDRAAAVPGLGIQLGAGGREELVRLGDDTASSVSVLTRFRATTRMEPLAGVRVSLAYEAAGGDAGGARAQRISQDRKWPEIEVQWAGLPIGRITRGAVPSLAITTGLSRESRSLEDAGSDARYGTVQTRVPVAVGLGLRGGLNLSYRGEWRVAGQDAVYHRMQSLDGVQTLTATGPIRIPDVWGATDRRVALSLSYTQSDRSECRRSADHAACGPENEIVDTQDQVLRIQAGTQIHGFNVGLHGDYVGRASRIGQREASRHLRFGLFAEFELTPPPAAIP